MTESLDAFRAAYRTAFTAHLDEGDESGLLGAYELGRNAMQNKISVLDLAIIHHDVVSEILEGGSRSVRAVADAASTFLLEALSTHEMIHRGISEAHENATLRQAHAEQLRRLADASVAIHTASHTSEMLEHISRHAVLVLEAAGARAALTRGTDGTAGSTSRTYPPAASDLGPDAARLSASLSRRNGADLGLIEVHAGPGQSFSANDSAVLTQLAQLAGVALENAELYEQERVVAETLQRRLLPSGLAALDGVTLASRYLPGAEGSDVGGDWYDSLVLPNNQLALVVGDVVGKGIRAAAGMGQIRIALRAYAIEGHGPGAVVSQLGRVLEELEEDFATAVYLVYDTATRALRYANAGHPPPILVPPGATPLLLGGALSPPLGTTVGADCAEETTTVPRGSTLIVYTDGLIERRGTDIDRGLDRLQEVAAAADTSNLESFCDEVLAAMDVDTREDDIALLAARFDDGDR